MLFYLIELTRGEDLVHIDNSRSKVFSQESCIRRPGDNCQGGSEHIALDSGRSCVIYYQKLLSALFRLPDKFHGALKSGYKMSKKSIKTREERLERRGGSTSAHGPTERRSLREHTSMRIQK
jgi:hypothetical protein